MPDNTGRCVVAALILAAAWPAVAQQKSRAATEAAYPSRPVRVLVAQAAGGPTDVAARIYGTKMSELTGQQFVIDNRPGAGGSIAGEITARAPADGYTLVVAANGTIAIAPHLIRLSYDARRDLAAVALIGNSPLALMVHPPLPAGTLKEFIALVKARPGKINFGSSGLGATGHLAGEMLKMLAGVNIVHVPYKGAGPALIGLMSGEIEMLISGLSSGLPYIRQKQVRVLGVTSPKRVPQLPETPAMAEIVPGYDVGSWYAVFATAGTPQGVIGQLNRESIKAVSSPDVEPKLIAAGVILEHLTPPALAAKIDNEWERWGKVIKMIGMKPH